MNPIHLNPRRKRWNEADKAVLRQHFPTGGAEACKPLLSRPLSLAAISSYAYTHLDLCKTVRRGSNNPIPPKAERATYPYGLADREMRALISMSTGRGAKGIAIDMCISVHTANDYIKGVFRKLGVNNQVSAVIKAEREGILARYDRRHPSHQGAKP